MKYFFLGIALSSATYLLLAGLLVVTLPGLYFNSHSSLFLGLYPVMAVLLIAFTLALWKRTYSLSLGLVIGVMISILATTILVAGA